MLRIVPVLPDPDAPTINQGPYVAEPRAVPNSQLPIPNQGGSIMDGIPSTKCTQHGGEIGGVPQP